VGAEGFVNVRSINHASVNVICFESCVLYSSGVILCYVIGSFPWRFTGGTVSEVDCEFSLWVTCISHRTETTALFAAY